MHIDEEEIKQAYHSNVVLEGIKMSFEEYREIFIAVRLELENDSDNTEN